MSMEIGKLVQAAWEMYGHDDCLKNGEAEDCRLSVRCISVSELSRMGTVCGEEGNQPFTEEVQKYLWNHDVYVVGAVVLEDQDAIPPCKIFDMAARLTDDQGEKFSDMIDENGGGLRYNCVEDGICTFESE